MNSQFGFDFGEVAKFEPIEMPPGTWTERLSEAMLPREVEMALGQINEVPEGVARLFQAGVAAAARTLSDIRGDTRHGEFRGHELRSIRIEHVGQDISDFISLCRMQTSAGPVTGRVTRKVREAFDCSTYAVHVENVGTLSAQRWLVNGQVALCFAPGPRGTFFLDGYEDDMQSVALPYEIWGPTYAADKLAFSNKGVASVPTFRYQSREYFVSGTTSGGANNAIRGTAWRLCPPEQWHGERYTYHSLGLAVNAGTRQRGDERGMVVLVRGREFVVEGAVLVYDPNGWHLTSRLVSETDSGDDEPDLDGDADGDGEEEDRLCEEVAV